MRPILFRVSILLLLLAIVGCSYTSVGHLQRQPWILNTEQGLEMRFWNFLYIAESSEGKYRITGRAMPRAENLPENLNWIDDLWLAAYLSDDQGRVLAQDLQVLSSLPLDPDQGVPFMFTLRPDRLNRSASLQITFGYNMTLTPHELYLQQDAAEAGRSEGRSAVFFAHEGALTKI
ncbi:hypothetical protein [Desulfonatronum thioautotrophicum]|uniref:hypothetical protein n=1 Tax=Desulfonatronum thioautotrophicum TaxID=617001 RepID=UPI0005EAECD9|nr:hypothetical protein [Desulfonatronum thioautotrophicum]